MRKILLTICSGMILVAGQLAALGGEETKVYTNALNDLVKAGDSIPNVSVFRGELKSANAVRVSGNMGGVFLPRGVKWETDAPTKELNEGSPIYGNRDYRYGAVPAAWRGLKVVQGMADQNMSFRITFSEPVSSEIYFIDPRENLKIETISRRLACFRVPPAASPLQADSLSAWDGADRLTRFLKYPESEPMEADLPTEAAFMQDNDYLYFLCKARVPEKYNLVAKAVGKEGDIWQDDIIELFLQPEPNSGKYFHFAFNDKGARYAAREEKIRVGAAADEVKYEIKYDKSWDPGAEIISRWTPGAPEWILRVKIPFKSLGVSSVPPGAVWHINVCRFSPAGQGLPQGCMSWAFVGSSETGFQTPESFRPMVFCSGVGDKGMQFSGLSGFSGYQKNSLEGSKRLQLGSWIVQGTAAVRADGEIVLKDQNSAVEQSVCITNLARHRFVCFLNCRGDEENIPLWISFFYRDAADRKVREIRAFEYARTLALPMGYKEDIAFPESAGTLERIRIARGAHNGSVSIGNVVLSAAPLAYLFLARFPQTTHAPPVVNHFMSGPTRSPAEGSGELNFFSPRLAMAVDVPTPLYFKLCGSRSNDVPGRIFFDLPPELTDLYVRIETGAFFKVLKDKPVKTGQITVDGITYNRYASPSYPVKDAPARGFISARAGGLPGRTFRIGYFLEWDGVAQPERWLEVDAISIPDGPTPKKFITAGGFIDEDVLPFMPGWAELWRRSGMNTVEMNAVGNIPRHIPVVKFIRDNGIRVTGEFGPGQCERYPYSVMKDPDMQGKGTDGKTVMLEHGRPAPCPSYRGENYRQQLDFLREWVRAYKIDIINFDDEFFVGNANYCFCDRCKSRFRDYMKKNHPALAEIDPAEIFKNAAQYPEQKKAWIQFKADLWTEWYRDYRRVADEEGAKINPKGKIEMYTTGDVPSERAKEYQLQDHATWLKEGIVQRLVPQIYLYGGDNKGIPRKIGDSLMKWQKELSPYKKGGQGLYIYLLGGWGWSVTLYPQEVMKYQVLEACTAGSINGFTLCPIVGTDAYHWKYLAEALHMVAKVEDILWDGKVEVLPCALPSAQARVIRKGDEAVLFVTEYSYNPVEVPVVLPVKKASLVTDVETGELVAELKPRASAFSVKFDKQRARLLKITPQPSFFEKIFSSVSDKIHGGQKNDKQ